MLSSTLQYKVIVPLFLAEVAVMKAWKPPSLGLIALGEWLLLLPPSLLLAVAALRMLLPGQFEPGRTSRLISNWTTAHISRPGAGILFLGMPSVVLFTGCAALWKRWHEDQDLRNDVAFVAAILWRRGAILIVVTATLLAAAVLAMVVGHVITDRGDQTKAAMPVIFSPMTSLWMSFVPS